MKNGIAIFDIGKTNKKFFVFQQEDYQILHQESTCFLEIEDADGFPSDDLTGIENWMKDRLSWALSQKEFDIKALNVSAYGASLVHLGKNGEPVLPLVNYLKPIPEEVLDQFYTQYGSSQQIARETGSPALAMLNSGLQLYWLKHTQPEVFRHVHTTLHFPQYLSYLFSRIPVSEFTSVGCHTALWDMEVHQYHHWVLQEKLDSLFPPFTQSTSQQVVLEGHQLRIGHGLHDSSSALIPYLASEKQPFCLLSTGTWSIALNPFSNDPLTTEELKHDCLCFLQPNGKQVKASRLFLGQEHKEQVEKLNAHFSTSPSYHQSLSFQPKHLQTPRSGAIPFFHVTDDNLPSKALDLSRCTGYDEAYHVLIQELVRLQVTALMRAIGSSRPSRLLVDGGFSRNKIFVELLADALPDMDVIVITESPGSALGAAMAIAKDL